MSLSASRFVKSRQWLAAALAVTVGFATPAAWGQEPVAEVPATPVVESETPPAEVPVNPAPAAPVTQEAPAIVASEAPASVVAGEAGIEVTAEKVAVATTEAAEEGVAEPSKYWIGVGLKKVEGDLATHLGSDKGMMVFQIYPESPAGKAGWKEGDILLSFNGKDIDGDFGPLLEEIKAVEGKATKVVLIRHGSKVEQEITPEVRPESVAGAEAGTFQIVPQDASRWIFSPSAEGAAGLAISPQSLEGLMVLGAEGLEGGSEDQKKIILRALKAGQDLDITNVGPGLAVVGGEEMPKSLSITVTKKDEAPATITVTVDGEKHEASEDKLDALPEKVRPWAEKVLKGGKVMTFKVDGSGSVKGGEIKVDASAAGPAVKRTIIINGEKVADGAEGIAEVHSEANVNVFVHEGKDGEVRVLNIDPKSVISQEKIMALVEEAKANAKKAQSEGAKAGAATEEMRKEIRLRVEGMKKEAAAMAEEAVKKARVAREKAAPAKDDGDVAKLKKEVAELRKLLEEVKKSQSDK